MKGRACTEQSLAVLCGGAGGAVCRVLLHTALTAALGPGFPYGILCANVLGSLALGFLFGRLSRKKSPHAALYPLIGTGFLGGFTTFSTFSADTVSLYATGHHLAAALNILVSLSLCLAAAGLGIRAGSGGRFRTPRGT